MEMVADACEEVSSPLAGFDAPVELLNSGSSSLVAVSESTNRSTHYMHIQAAAAAAEQQQQQEVSDASRRKDAADWGVVDTAVVSMFVYVLTCDACSILFCSALNKNTHTDTRTAESVDTAHTLIDGDIPPATVCVVADQVNSNGSSRHRGRAAWLSMSTQTLQLNPKRKSAPKFCSKTMRNACRLNMKHRCSKRESNGSDLKNTATCRCAIRNNTRIILALCLCFVCPQETF